MAIQPEAELEAPISIRLEDGTPISLRAFRSDRVAVLKIGRRTGEIELQPSQVRALRDQLPDILAALDQGMTADDACETAKTLTTGTVHTSMATRTAAMEAAEAGLDDLAAEAEAAAEWARMCVYVVDAAIQTLREATRAADCATDVAYQAANKIEAELTRLRDPALTKKQDSR